MRLIILPSKTSCSVYKHATVAPVVGDEIHAPWIIAFTSCHAVLTQPFSGDTMGRIRYSTAQRVSLVELYFKRVCRKMPQKLWCLFPGEQFKVNKVQ